MKFHILEVRKGKPSFREVTGEAVEIGEGIQAFFMRPLSGEWHCLYDVVSGARLTDVMDTDDAAILSARGYLKVCGVNFHKRRQEHHRILYGSPPEIEIEIIQEPVDLVDPGEIETCSRETSCGHH